VAVAFKLYSILEGAAEAMWACGVPLLLFDEVRFLMTANAADKNTSIRQLRVDVQLMCTCCEAVTPGYVGPAWAVTLNALGVASLLRDAQKRYVRQNVFTASEIEGYLGTSPDSWMTALLAALNRADMLIQSVERVVREERELSETTAAIRLLTTNGDVPRLVATIDAHPIKVVVAREVCRALAGLAAGDAVRVLNTNGGVAAVVSALQAHPHNTEVALTACRAIAYMGAAAASKVFIAPGAYPALLSALRAHPHNEDVGAYGAWSLLIQAAYTAGIPVGKSSAGTTGSGMVLAELYDHFHL
jgi:hypothetical protein